MLTPIEAAKLLGVTSQAVRLWIREGRIAYVKVGGYYRIDEDTVKDILTPHAPTNTFER